MTRGMRRIRAWMTSRARRRRAKVVEVAVPPEGATSERHCSPGRVRFHIQRMSEALAQPRSRMWLRGLTFLFLVGAAYGLWQGSRPARLALDSFIYPPGTTLQEEESIVGLPQGHVAELTHRVSTPLFEVALAHDFIVPTRGVTDENVRDDEVEPVVVLPALPDILDLTQVVWPIVGGVQGEYGWHRDPVTDDWRFRSGLILEPEREQARVRASLAGEVTRIDTAGNGYRVTVTHAEGWSTEYGGLSSLDVREGQRVNVGDPLGDISVAAHRSGLTFVMRDAQGPIDPGDVLYTPPPMTQ